VNQPEDLNQPEHLHHVDGEPCDQSSDQLCESSAELERYLTQALRPVAPPNGFAERIMARIEPASPAHAKPILTMIRPRRWANWTSPTSWTVWSSGAIAAALLVGFLIAGQIQARHRRQQAEFAEHQFELALRITGETLDQTRQQLRQAGVDLGN
jgi:hypothetical protein